MQKFLLGIFVLLSTVGCDGAFPLSLSNGGGAAAASADGQTGPVRVYFTKPEGDPSDPNNPARILAGYIGQAKKTIDVCAFELDNEVIVDALVQAVNRGVQIRLVTETDYLHESGVKAMHVARVPIVDDQRDGALMHNKFMVFDNQSVWTGSMNFTENCAYKNNNHGVFIDDPRIAANYATKFRWFFDQRKFGGAPSRSDLIPHPVVTLNDGTKIENYFSTHDNVADRVIETVGVARRSVYFMAFSFTHDDICNAMLNRARAGVEVLGVFEKSQAANSYSEDEKMRAFGPPVQVYIDGNSRNMHHKAIIVDSNVTVAGSFNFSASADKSNDENVVIIHNQDIAQRFEQEFQYVFGVAKSAANGAVVNSRRR